MKLSLPVNGSEEKVRAEVETKVAVSRKLDSSTCVPLTIRARR